jgi:hypothetical protein
MGPDVGKNLVMTTFNILIFSRRFGKSFDFTPSVVFTRLKFNCDYSFKKYVTIVLSQYLF